MLKVELYILILSFLTSVSNIYGASKTSESLISRAEKLSRLDRESFSFEQEAFKLAVDVTHFGELEISNGNTGEALRVLAIASRVLTWRKDISNLREKATNQFISVTKKMLAVKKVDCRKINSRVRFLESISSDFASEINIREICNLNSHSENVRLEHTSVLRNNKIEDRVNVKVHRGVNKNNIESFDEFFKKLSAVETPKTPKEFKNDAKLRLEYELRRAKKINEAKGLIEFLERMSLDFLESSLNNNYIECSKFHVDSEERVGSKIKIISDCDFHRKKIEKRKIQNYKNLIVREFGLVNGKEVVRIEDRLSGIDFKFKTSEKISKIISLYFNLLNGAYSGDAQPKVIILKAFAIEKGESKLVDSFISTRSPHSIFPNKITQSYSVDNFMDYCEKMASVGAICHWSDYSQNIVFNSNSILKLERKDIYLLKNELKNFRVSIEGSTVEDLARYRSVKIELDVKNTAKLMKLITNQAKEIIKKELGQLVVFTPPSGYNKFNTLSELLTRFAQGEIVCIEDFSHKMNLFDLNDFNCSRKYINWRSIIDNKNIEITKFPPLDYNLSVRFIDYLYGVFRGTFISNYLSKLADKMKRPYAYP